SPSVLLLCLPRPATSPLVPYTTLFRSGPILLVRLSGKRLRPGSMLGAMWSGFILTLIFHLLPDSPGDFLERVLPFVASLGIALRSEEHTSELQSRENLVCRLLLEKKKQ